MTLQSSDAGKALCHCVSLQIYKLILQEEVPAIAAMVESEVVHEAYMNSWVQVCEGGVW